MNALHSLIKTKLKLQDNSVAFGPESEWTEFSSIIRESLKIIRPDAVYHFNKQPFILFFDFTKPKNRERESILHKQIWCFDKAPIVFFIFDDEVQIYNAFRYQREYDKLEMFNISDYEQQFSFWRLQSGKTWQWLQDTFNYKNIKKERVDQKLFDNIKETRKKLTEDITPPLEDTFANTLILRLIFIRYLIDRGVEIDERFITGNTPAERKQHLNQIIGDKVELNNFFSHLEDRFNGNLFETKKDPEIAQKHLVELSRIFSTHKDQLFLFDIFDFSIIPVETISGIYESVIHPEKRASNSAIYTPPFIVDYILAQTVNDDYLEERNECRILDPACGSGIFLVQAYRRMVERNKNNEGIISDERLAQLIQQNLFGIDKDENALNVTAFSLYVALLDYKDPPEIKKFKLPRLLNTNLFEADFLDEEASFNSEEAFQNKQFDFILGNPPWGNKKYKKHLDYNKKHKIPIARNEIAQTFLARTKDFANKHTQCALIITSKAFYNKWAKEFVSYFFTGFHISHLFDLSPVRRWIFEADNPALIVFYRYAFGDSTSENVIKHFSVKPNLYLRYFKALVIEKQDQKEILQKHFIDHEWMLKVALYGNTIDFHFIKKLVSQPDTVASFIERFDDIYQGDGIKKLTPNAFEKLSPEQKETVEPFDEISDIPILEISDITQYYSVVNKDHLPQEEDLYLKSGKRIKLYIGERILLRTRPKKETQIIASYVDTKCVYRQRVLGIATETKLEELKLLHGIFNSKLYTYYQFLTASSWGVFYPEILQHECLMFPYTKIRDNEKFVQVVNQLIDYYKGKGLQSVKPDELLEQINEMVNTAYEVNELEKDLIDYVLDISRYQFQESKLQRLIRRPSDDDLKRYAKIFYDHFSDIYNEDDEYFQIDIYRLPYFVAMTFNIVESPPEPENGIVFPEHNHTEQTLLQTIAQTASINELSESIFSQKDIKGFEEDFFYIIKPDEYKCWHRAIAHYDLAEFVEAIEKAELEELTEAIDE